MALRILSGSAVSASLSIPGRRSLRSAGLSLSREREVRERRAPSWRGLLRLRLRLLGFCSCRDLIRLAQCREFSAQCRKLAPHLQKLCARLGELLREFTGRRIRSGYRIRSRRRGRRHFRGGVRSRRRDFWCFCLRGLSQEGQGSQKCEEPASRSHPMFLSLIVLLAAVHRHF